MPPQPKSWSCVQNYVMRWFLFMIRTAGSLSALLPGTFISGRPWLLIPQYFCTMLWPHGTHFLWFRHFATLLLLCFPLYIAFITLSLSPVFFSNRLLTILISTHSFIYLLTYLFTVCLRELSVAQIVKFLIVGWLLNIRNTFEWIWMLLWSNLRYYGNCLQRLKKGPTEVPTRDSVFRHKP